MGPKRHMVQAIVGGWQCSCGASMWRYVDATGSHGCAEQVICGSKQCQMVYVCVGVVMVVAAASALTYSFDQAAAWVGCRTRLHL